VTAAGPQPTFTITPQSLYLALCVAGTVLPYSQFVPFLREHGLDLRVFAGQLFANHVSSFFALDVIVSSAVLVALVTIDGRRAGVRPLWLPIAATLTVGVSLGLPLFLYMRERRLASAAHEGRGPVHGGTVR
jgi:hypothetical protein